MAEPKLKVAITLDPDVLDEIRARVQSGRARSVSAYIQHAVQSQLAAEADFDTLVEQRLAETGGPATAKERRAARRLLSGSAA